MQLLLFCTYGLCYTLCYFAQAVFYSLSSVIIIIIIIITSMIRTVNTYGGRGREEVYIKLRSHIQ